jgi:hypothetical protein
MNGSASLAVARLHLSFFLVHLVFHQEALLPGASGKTPLPLASFISLQRATASGALSFVFLKFGSGALPFVFLKFLFHHSYY